MRPRHALALLLAALGLVATGCGSDGKEKNAYVDQVAAAQTAFLKRFDDISKRLTPTSTAPQDRSTLGAFADATGAFVTRLRAIKPPSAVRTQHTALIDAVRGYQTEVGAAQKQLAKGSAADRAKVRTNLSSSIKVTQGDIERAITAINAALRG